MNYFNQRSERLQFRKLSEADIPLWIPFFENNDRLRFLGVDSSKSKEELAENWILKQLERYEIDGFGHLAIELKSTKAFIGQAGILPRMIKGQKEYEIGYSLKKEYWGKGYATEAAKALKAYGMQHIDSNRFISIIHIENVDSIKVAKKNGMEILFQTEFMGMPVNIYGIENAKR